jgi:transposase
VSWLKRRSADEQALKGEIERLRRKLAERDRQLAKAEQQIAESKKQIAEAEKKIDDLERQLALRQQNSTTTSKPPSSDGLAGRQRVRGRRTKSRRKPGGQPGHPGHCRPLVPLARVNEVKVLFPDACGHCHRRLPTRARPVSGEPRRHQVTEVPPIEAHITEYQCPPVVCPECGHVTQAPLPEDIEGQFGPQLTALIAYLTVVCRLPRQVVRRLLESVLQISISVGSTQHAWEEASTAVAPVYQELEQALPRQPVLNIDETGHRTKGEKRWLWTLVAPTFVFYTIATSRGAEVLRQLLGQRFAGILCSDRLKTYVTYAAACRQFCWAHGIRNLLSAQELAKTAAGQRFCRDALRSIRRVFRLWHRFQGDPHARGAPLSRPELIRKVRPIAKKLFALANQHLHVADKDVRNLACAFVEHHESFFTFVKKKGVEPTNNRAERCLRPAVQWRKVIFGTRSAEGELAVARLLTITQTCQLQQQNALVYLTAAIRCHRRRQAVASLLPKKRL